MRYCAVLLLLCLLIFPPAASTDFLANCGTGLVNGEGAEVRVNTVPDGVRVSIDNNPVGATPYQENLGLRGYTNGQHTLVLTSPGYQTATMNFNLCTGFLTDIRVEMKPLTPATTEPTKVTQTTQERNSNNPSQGARDDTGSPAGEVPQVPTGSLSVTSQPPGAEVYLDGSLRGISPLTLDGIAPGTHSLLLRSPGYSDDSVLIDIPAGGTQSYTATLRPAVAGTSPAGASSPAGQYSPGFEGAMALLGIGVLLLLRSR